MSDIVERLNATRDYFDYEGVKCAEAPINPDGAEAAAEITRLRAELSMMTTERTAHAASGNGWYTRALLAERERDALREALTEIAGFKGEFSVPWPESHEGYGPFAVMTARAALKGASHD